jgi:transcriptional regulator of acetoin/glycerol metabolism
LKDVEWDHIQNVMAKSGGRVSVAAEKLGIPRSSLYEKLKQHRTAANSN